MMLSLDHGVRLHYDDFGAGEPVVFVAGSDARGTSWQLYQVPAMVAAGYRVITFDNRGVPLTEAPPGPIHVDDLVADTIGLIEGLGLGPCRLVGTSMGAHVVAELLILRPDLARQAVLMATRGRPDVLSRALAAAEREVHDSGHRLPARYDAVVRAMQNLSPVTLRDDQTVADWLDVFEMSGGASLPGERGHLDVELITDRRPAYARITVPTLVVGFADDLIMPAVRGREVAEVLPRGRYVEIADTGHYGYLERPDEVNRQLLDFFAVD